MKKEKKRIVLASDADAAENRISRPNYRAREGGRNDAISRGGQSGRRGKYKSNPSRQKAAVVKYGLACRIRGSSRNSALDSLQHEASEKERG